MPCSFSVNEDQVLSSSFTQLVRHLVIFCCLLFFKLYEIQVAVLPGEKSEVTALARDPQCKNMAVGYQDGSIRIFNLSSKECDLSFQGHKSAITTLAYDAHGLRLVSGSKVKFCLIVYHLFVYNLTQQTLKAT